MGRSPQVQPWKRGHKKPGKKGTGRACGNSRLACAPGSLTPEPRYSLSRKRLSGGGGSLPSPIAPLDRMLQSVSDRTRLLTAQECSRAEPRSLISVWACHTAGIMQVVVGPPTAPKLWKSPSWQNGTAVAYPDAQAKNLHSFLHPQHHSAGQGTPEHLGTKISTVL